MNVKTQLPEEELWRANMYSLLATLMGAAPQQETLDRLQQISAADESTQITRAWSNLLWRARELSREAIDREYHDVFIGITGGKVTPYASYYLSGFMHEKPLARLRDTLARLGLERQAHVHEPEDHVATLCEIMGVLVLEYPLPVQKRFFLDHVAAWMARLFDDLAALADAPFYQALGELGRAFLTLERISMDLLD